MSWKVRHEGSPQAVEVQDAQQVAQGLVDGLWEPTDEVMGPGEASWTQLGSHPAFAEVAAEVEPPPPRHYDDETHLDMNALIDVCLVLLIFFIMTTSYAALQKQIESPTLTSDKAGPREVKQEEVAQQMVLVKIKMEGGDTVYLVEGETVPEQNLRGRLARAKSGKAGNVLLLEVEPKVPHRCSVTVQDAAFGLFDKVLRVLPS